ncbi:hypothetical protein [Mesonia sp.]|uniref:hypothetical protein n=1 Tax=Mesonia sp. TaxID=1960830 RepID=UPI00176509AD|nr:hypothetical protein [Mesonia sp.]HIB36346.1 hypothetical protein [Mesonia sp.]HIO25869.1 hypothetical protein [Flavobacteriaceae bacterium]
MKTYRLLVFVSLTLFSSLKMLGVNSAEINSIEIQQINQIIISVDESGAILFNEEKTELSSLEKQISDRIDFFVEKGFDKPTVTIRIFEDTSTEILENIKAEVRKTSIEFLDIQQTKKVEKKVEEVDSLDIQKYKKIITAWKQQNETDRTFNKADVEFVRNVYKRMNFNQMMRAGKLPSFVPKVEELDTIN